MKLKLFLNYTSKIIINIISNTTFFTHNILNPIQDVEWW